MIDSIIRLSIQHKLIVGILSLGLVVWGLYSIRMLPLDAVPDITDNQVQVITTSPTLAAQEVEKLITYPLEISMGNIPGVREIRSVSRFGLSVITVVFEEEVPVYRARQLINERIEAAAGDIPAGLGQPEMGPITTGLGEIYQYVLYPDKGYESTYSATDLRTLQDWLVKRQLTGIKGVVEVNSSGGFLKQYEVAVDPDKLNAMNITLPEIFDALLHNNANAGGSYIEKEHYTYFIRGEGLLESREDIEQVVVKNRAGIPVLIKDVAVVQMGHAPRFGAVTMNGRGEVVAGQVLMLKGENSAEVTQRVKKRMEQIRQSLPKGVIMEPYLDRTKLVNRTTKTVITNLVEGGLIVIFILVLLLGNWRAGLIVASVIPLSMLFAVAMMNIFGVSANLMSLGAIDFGLIVDGAVIIVEAIVHRLGLRQGQHSLNQVEMDAAVLDSATRIRKSAAFGEVIILIVYLPILFLTGIEGKMFKPMAQTVSFAILGALLLSLTYVPMMAALVLSKKPTKREGLASAIMARIYQSYRPVLNLAMRAKSLVLIVTLAIFVLSLWQFTRLGGEFIPTLEEGDFALHQILPSGSSIKQGVEVSAELQNILLDQFPEVEKVVTKIGTAEIPTDIMPLEAGDIFVILKPKEEWTSGRTKEELFEKMETALNQFPGVVYEFTQPIQMRFNELMTGIRQDIAIKIYGEDLGTLLQHANDARDLIQSIEGVGDIQVEPVFGLQQIVVDYDRRKIARYGIEVQQINQMLEMAFAGSRAGFIFEGEKRFDLVVRVNSPFRNELSDISNLYIPAPNGQSIPLQELATVEFREGPAQISRDDTKRRITIGVNARQRDLESLILDIQQKLNTDLKLPAGYYLTYGGQFENLQRARARLSIVVPIALALIFILLYLTFNSISQSLLIYTAIPLSAIGGIWALYLRDMPFSISAGVGFIALFGVAVLNGIVLMASFNQLKKEGMEDLLERIREGTKLRLRPVVMTASVASLGFLPMAISNSAGAEVQQPLATVVIGGLISATFLTLIVLPILYYFLEKSRFRSTGLSSMILLFFLAGATSLNGQSINISLEEALDMATTRHPSLVKDQLAVQQQQALFPTARSQPFAEVFISSEEFDFSANQGVHSLGINQAFQLPKSIQAKEALLNAQQELASVKRAITIQDLKKEVQLAYYQLLYQQEQEKLLTEQLQTYQEFIQITQGRFEAGESGKLPLLSVQSREAKIQWQLEQQKNGYEVALLAFNQWLFSDTTFTPQEQQLPIPTAPPAANIEQHPILQYQGQQRAVAQRQVALVQQKAAPRINAGFKLQSVAGQFPFFAYQLGTQFPLFKKSLNAQKEAAEVGVKIAEANLQTTQTRLRQQVQLIDAQLAQISTGLQQLNSNWRPVLDKQIPLFREAYRQGEIRYSDYLDLLEEKIDLQKQALNLLYQYHRLMVKRAYLSRR